MRPAKDTERHIRKVYADGLKVTTSGDLDERILNNVMETLNKLKKNESAGIEPNAWRLIMKSRVAKLAIAAVVVVAATFGMLDIIGIGGSSSIVWADVVEPLLNARTAIFDIIVGSDGNQTVIHDEVMGSRIRRTVSNIVGPDIIIDLAQQKMLVLDHAKKTAVAIELAGLDGVENYLQKLQNLVVKFEEDPDFSVENQGPQEIDGREYIVFVANGDNQRITIWADPETALPIRIEHKTPNMQITCDNMQFDVQLEESLFSMKVPDGYATQDAGIDFKDSSESSFIETLRIWAEIIENGQFPEGIALEDVVEMGSKFDQGMKRAGLTEEQQVEVATRWGQGYVFIRFFKGQGQWHYAGQGVKLGDGSKAIFWYQPQGSETWRVIYGDLRVEDVAAENLPQEVNGGHAMTVEKFGAQFKSKYVVSEEDEWTFVSSNEISARSELVISKSPETYEDLIVQLPFPDAAIQEVKLGNDDLPFSRLEGEEYGVDLSSHRDAAESGSITVLWTFPISSLAQRSETWGYMTPLKSLAPSDSFSLTVTIAEGSGFRFIKNSEARSQRPFSASYDKPRMDHGRCGTGIERE